MVGEAELHQIEARVDLRKFWRQEDIRTSKQEGNRVLFFVANCYIASAAERQFPRPMQTFAQVVVLLL